MRIENKHVYFWGGRYSNFYGCFINYSLCAEMKPILFNCSEQIYMAHKALFFGDFEALHKILNSNIPREQKAIGRTVKDFNQDDWMEVAYDFMVRAVYSKFSQNAELREHMVTLAGHAFVEASPTDCIWGVGLAEEDDRILDPANWRGTNLLGKALDQTMAHFLRQDKIDSELKASLQG